MDAVLSIGIDQVRATVQVSLHPSMYFCVLWGAAFHGNGKKRIGAVERTTTSALPFVHEVQKPSPTPLRNSDETERTTSRMPTIPTGRSPSTTGR